jgi:hypothetical protein
MVFTNKVGAITEEETHHPRIIMEYESVTVGWWTHKIGGFHKNDFIMGVGKLVTGDEYPDGQHSQEALLRVSLFCGPLPFTLAPRS